MKKKHTAKIAGLTLAVALLGASVPAAVLTSSAIVRAETATVETAEINDYYFVGDEIEIPATAEIKLADGQIKTGNYEATLTPDGKFLSGKTTELVETGEYFAVYSLTENGKKYSAKKPFVVTEKKWSVGSTASGVEYTDKLTANRYGGKGLKLTLAAGDKFTFSSPIDLSGGNLTDVITMYSTAMQAKGDAAWNNNNKTAINNGTLQARNVVYEAGIIEVTLTDCYDPSISVSLVNFISTLNGEGAYARTRATGQGEFGLYENCPPKFGKKEIVIDGTPYGVYVGDFGMSVTGSADKKAISWSINAESGDIYYNWYNGGGKKAGGHLINQLYNEEVSGGAIFPGFTTGEVYLSITASENYTTSTTFHIESIGDYTGEQLVDGRYEDEIAPTVVIDKEGEYFVKVGDEFELLPATAYDPNSVGDITKKVYFNYGSNMQSSVLVKNNRFIPETVGRYVIEYTAKDSFGNVGRATVSVNAVAKAPATLTVEKTDEMKAGVRTELPEYVAKSLNGKVTVEITAECGDKIFNVEDGSFIPTAVGEYVIRYVYKDKLKTYEYSYTVNCAANEEKAFITEPVFDDCYIKGLAYTLPVAKAYEFRGAEPKLFAHDIYVSFDGGNFVKVTDPDSFTISGNSTVRFKYVAETAEILSDEIKITDVGYGSAIDLAKYFVGDFTANKDYSYIGFASNARSGDNTLAFINPLAYSVFSLSWTIPADKANISAYSVILTDKRSGKENVIKFYKVGSRNYVSLNGGDAKTLREDIYGDTSRELSFDVGSGAFVYACSGQTVTLPVSGISASSELSLKIRLEGICGDAAVNVSSVQNQLMSRNTTDDAEPLVYARRDIGSAGIGTKDIIYAAVASDALSPVTKDNLTVTIRTPGGNYLTAKDGTVLNNAPADKDYEVEYSEYGVYVIRYIAKDASGNAGRQPYMVEIADDVAPTIKFKDGSNKETVQKIKVGYKYKVKTYTVADNYSKTDKLTVVTYLYTADGVIINQNFEEFTITEAGDYEVYVYVIDEAGNYAYAQYKLRASGK